MKLQIKKIYPDAILPTRAYSTDSGLDLYAYIEPKEIKIKYAKGRINIGEEIKEVRHTLVRPKETVLVETGIAIKLPEPTEVCVYANSNIRFVWEAQFRSKSGRALKDGLIVLNSPGTIDNGYTGQIKGIMYNASNKDLYIHHGEKIAQLVVCPVVIPTLSVVEDFITGEEGRGSNGFGSTGV